MKVEIKNIEIKFYILNQLTRQVKTINQFILITKSKEFFQRMRIQL